MSILRRIFLHNILAGILFSLILCFCIGQYISGTLNLQQQNHIQTIKSLSTSTDSNQPKELIKTLKSQFAYQHLKIVSNDGTVLHQYAPQDPIDTFSQQWMLWFNQAPTEVDFTAENGQYNIHFTLAFIKEFKQTDRFIFLSVTLIFVLLLFTSFITLLNIKKSIAKTANQFKAQLNNDNALPVAQFNSESIPKECLPLVEPLNQIHQKSRQEIEQWKSSAESLQVEAKIDELTGLANRNCFLDFLKQELTDVSADKFGILAIIRATELQSINQSRGYHEGDEYINAIAQALTRVSNSYKGACLYRINGADFAMVAPHITLKEADNLAKSLTGRLTELQKIFETNSIAYSGIVGYESNDDLSELLALADTGINLAQTKTANACHIQNDKSVLNNVSSKYGSQNWRDIIEDVLVNQRVILFAQPIQPTNKSTKVYSEILARFSNKDGQVMPTHSFIAMAERMDKIIAIDRLIIECTINLIKQKNLVNQSFAINLTAKSAHDEQFVIWLERRLLRETGVAAKLVFELTEFGLQQNAAASKRFVSMLHRSGARITVERFGIGFTSFKFFRELKPDFIKLDGSYSRNIDEDKNNQYFVRILIDLAHRIGVSVLAESVETEIEKHTLEKIFIDGTQGYFIGKPTEL
ncbi:EAL domain-containing protein [Catenovulum adriaticum]|uniref:EAL domain-containing protein n=1 Tax=Catenovulum adriaticum TaxID=2984846 RepID=A0ABY7AL81_9ALTE|nr:EAL domain-containing protein [Catenovulum sp. TS8]WAJ69492.1 EAL domain-containing protein [Catenovulum sp. TS8]